MYHWINKLIASTPAQSISKLAPDQPFHAIGDVHGRLDLLQDRIEKLDPSLPIVLVGDYIDRGEDSAGVLDYLIARPNLYCLAGNHEQLMLDFIDRPTETMNTWLRNGGLQTLASLGIGRGPKSRSSQTAVHLRDQLLDALGPDRLRWLRALPHYLCNGNVVIVHAALDPHRCLAEQVSDTMLWGHAEFPKTPRSDGLWVVHGHTIVPQPVAEQGRISIDTGAYATGRLTSATITTNGVTFLER